MTEKVFAIIVHRNGTDLIRRCLRDLSEQKGDFHLHLLVSDNASTDDSPQWIIKNFPDVTLLDNAGNFGWSKGNNVGIKEALRQGADWVWLLNDDTEIPAHCLKNMLAYARTTHTKLLAPVIYYLNPPDKVWFQGAYIDMQSMTSVHAESLSEFRNLPPEKKPFLTGCSLLIHRTVFEAVGLLDERFFMYYDDTSFCLKATQAGFALAVVENAHMYHHLGGGTGYSPFHIYHIFRSTLLFWRKQLGFWRFHLLFCRSHLHNWIGDVDFSPTNAPYAMAKTDALWFFLSGQNNYQKNPKSPVWFRRIIQTRGWLMVAIMSFDFKSIFRRKRR